MHDTAELAVEARRVLDALRAPELGPFLEIWPQLPPPRPARGAVSEGLGSPQLPESPLPALSPLPESSPLPALRWLQQLPSLAPPFSASLIIAIVRAAHRLTWRRSYTTSEVSAEFLDNYAWTEFVGLGAAVPSDHLACGVLLLGPRVTYPPHRHEAEEIYLPLAGTAAWMQGRAAWDSKPPGTLIHHARHEPHAMRTGDSPLLALYLWRSDDLAQKAALDCKRSAFSDQHF
jgi:hypothetical protein